MKNHRRINGQLLQTNKQYSALKTKQKEWINVTIIEEFEKMVKERGRAPDKKRRQWLVDRVYDRICQRGIWIPFYVVKPVIEKKTAKLTRKHITDNPLENA